MTGQALPITTGFARLSGPRRAVAMTFAFVVLWAMIEIAGSLGLHGVTVWRVVWARYTVHLLIVFAVWGRRGAASIVKTRAPVRQLVRSAMMLVMPASFAIAVMRGATPSAIMEGFWSAPLLVLGLALVLDGERPSARAWIAAALGWVGALLYYGSAGRPSLGAIVLSLAMAGSFALYDVMTRELRSEPLRVNMFYTAIVPWAVLLPFIFAGSPIGLRDILILVFIGAIGWLALAAVDRAADAAPVSQSAPMLHLQTGATALFAVLGGHAESVRRIAAATAVVGTTAVIAWIALPRNASTEIL